MQNITNGEGADVIIETVGITDTFEMTTTIRAPGARVVYFGQDYRAKAKIKTNDIVRYQRKILGSYIGYAEDFLDAIELIANKVIGVDELITATIPLSDFITTGFNLMNEGKCVKIITIP
ncbi:MAG: zinc-binding dehydrogenase [Candidatus Lokiarchaeota archaeon]|nr:zinc-binding dehydrogenase [Candidatus Lokiarchaeota archaeon]